MSVIHNDLLLATDEATGYNLTKSVRFRGSANAYLNKTPSTTATSNQKFTISFWFKTSLSLTSSNESWFFDCASQNFGLYYNINSKLALQLAGGAGYIVPTQVLRDPAAWYHIVIAVDTTQATASNRIKYYLNGTQITSFSEATYPSQNATYNWNQSGSSQFIGTNSSATARSFDGYMAEFYSIDGQQLTPSSFGETDTITGVWKPKAYTGTYGTNGFYLPFTDVATTSGSNAGLGKDFSGNGNYWTTNNISVTTGATYDSMTDVPTLTSATTANYCVINPLDKGANATVDNGNLRVYSSSGWTSNRGTMAFPTTGKYYFEWIFTDNTPAAMVGIATSQAGTSTQLGGDAYGWGYHYNGNKYNNNSGVAYGATYTTGDVIGVAFDAGTGALEFYKNNTSQGVAYTGLTTATYFPVSAVAGSTAAQGPTINFGQRGFLYTPPTGYVALNTYNLPDSTIVAGNKVMDATTYTGTSAAQNITNAGGFKPDLVWTKSRSDVTYNGLTDSVRGVSKALFSNATDAESSSANNYVTAFNSNGFGVNQGSVSGYTGYTYVGWQWQAGQGTTSSNTSGSITSTVSVNASAGFSIVTWTAGSTSSTQTVGHGLGVAPSFIITKSRTDAAGYWTVYHPVLASGYNLFLQLNAAAGTGTSGGWLAAPTSSVITLQAGTSSNINVNDGDMVGYCWSEIAGFSKFGSYTGNGSSSGPFIYTGFKPAFILVKCTSAVEEWYIGDNKRNLYNESAMGFLRPNTTGTETTTDWYKFYSNGFQMTYPGTDTNGSGRTYMYAAFAENPFKNSLAR